MGREDDERDSSWPRFELVAVPSSPDVPSFVARRLAEVGVPKGLIGGEYHVLANAELISDGLVAFGSQGFGGLICVETASNSVVALATPSDSIRRHVNADLDLFTSCVRAVIERFPFYEDVEFNEGEYDWDGELEKRKSAAEELGSLLLEIDSSALEFNGFWETFLDDVVIGDYSVEEVVGDDC